jgi:hypothetical protein
MIGVNPIVTNNNTIVTLHLNDEEHGSVQLAPYGEIHGEGASGLHRIAPHIRAISSAPLNSVDSVNTLLISMSIGGGDPSLINGDSSSSSRSMSSSEVVSAGALVFSFTLHSCFVKITNRIVLKCSSLSFSVASSLSFYAVIHWILLL